MSDQADAVVKAFRSLLERDQAEAYIEIDRLWKKRALENEEKRSAQR
jgi:hypothetical protein